MLPASKSQLSKLGKRLAAGTEAPDDEGLYTALLLAYDRVQRGLVDDLRDTDWSQAAVGLPKLTIVGRTKSLDTLAQKLRRSPDVQLPYIRDIAGIRLTGDMTRAQQTALGEWLVDRFDGRLVDRRQQPAHGYRALHAALTVQGLQVEAQIRTRLQHLWAQIFERVADGWGRQIRYGEPPDSPPDDTDGAVLRMRVDLIDKLQRTSEVIDVIEVLQDTTAPPGLPVVAAEVERLLLDVVGLFEVMPSGRASRATVERS